MVEGAKNQEYEGSSSSFTATNRHGVSSHHYSRFLTSSILTVFDVCLQAILLRRCEIGDLEEEEEHMVPLWMISTKGSHHITGRRTRKPFFQGSK